MVGEHSYHAQATVVRAGEGKRPGTKESAPKVKTTINTPKSGDVRLQISCFLVSCISLVCTFFLL